MITHLIIENFKAIEKLEVPLRPFTILVGPNDSGKSTILQALEIVSRSAQHPMHARQGPTIFGDGFDAYLTNGDHDKVMRFTVVGDLGGQAYEYRIGFRWGRDGGTIVGESLVLDGKADFAAPPNSADPGQRERSILIQQGHLAIARDIASTPIRWDLHHLVAPAALGTSLAEDGAGLASVIDEMLTASDREPLHQLEARLRQLSPYVGHLGTRVVASPAGAPPRKEVTYSLADKKGAIPASQMSGGVVLLTAFLWLRYGTNHQRYLIEDPENGIHPRATAMLAAFLRELAYEDQRQVIITTHSPFLLNQVSVEDVLVVTRHETHGIRVTPIVDAKFFAERIKELDLGELWYNIGEDELVADAS